MILDPQSAVRINLPAARAFANKLSAKLRLGRESFNVCFVGDSEMRRLNRRFRGKPKPTDVLSFPWQPRSSARRRLGRLRGFLGDIVISAETARRGARAEGHALTNEIHWLMLHGVLHLMGFDHERDGGEMAALELRLRDRLGI